MLDNMAHKSVVKSQPKSSEQVEDCRDVVIPNESISEKDRQRLLVIQRLEQQQDSADYRSAQAEASKEIGISIRSLQRLQRRYRESGPLGIRRQGRSDKGEFRVNESWRKFILDAYKAGNCGQRVTSCAQVSKLVASHAVKQGDRRYPSRRSVYRILSAETERAEQKRKSRSVGRQGEMLKLRTKEGIELDIEYSNQVWQSDHTRADIMVVDSEGEVLGCPTLTTVVDTYSRCIVGIHLGMEHPSAVVTCLALRHAILPKQYSQAYEPQEQWESYGVPPYLYTDAGCDFTSSHIDQVANSLGMVLCLHRCPSDGGIVERPFGTLNTEFFSTLPGYTTRRLKGRQRAVEAEARLTLEQLEGLLVRYITDNYNQQPDTRTGKESRMERWRSGCMAQMPVLERELDLLLMRQGHRRVYRGGYIRFANLLYKGEYLEGFAGHEVILRYDPRDITSLYVYRHQDNRETFLTRAHAQNLETERLSLSEAKAISRRLRQGRQEITNASVLAEIRERSQFVEALLESNRTAASELQKASSASDDENEEDEDKALEAPANRPPLPSIRVYDYEELRHSHGDFRPR